MINDDSVGMIPFGLLSGFVESAGKKKEVRIISLSERGFAIRTSDRLNRIGEAILHYYNYEKNTYEDVSFDSVAVVKESQDEFAYNYEIMITSDEYVRLTKNLINNYYNYITLKLDGDDGELSKSLTGYPAESDVVYARNFTEQKAGWLQNVSTIDISHVELAVELDNDKLYADYLSSDRDDFLRNYLTSNGADSMISECRLDRIYVGSQFCHNLFPDEKTLYDILAKSKREQIKVSVAFTYVRESILSYIEELLERLYIWCSNEGFPVEVIVNDWGMLSLLKERKQYLTPVFGILLNKQRKDPRMNYKNGYEENEDLLSENSMNSEIYRIYLEQEYGVNRCEYEACGRMIKLPAGSHSLHIPFYQTNTSQYCPLYARIKTGSRGRQELVRNCPKYCSEYVFLYPKHLHMVGRYNSLFALDEQIIKNNSIIEDYLTKGIDRIVVNLM